MADNDNRLDVRTASADILRERDLARRWGLSCRTLQRWRQQGTGPAWLRIGGGPRYRVADILDYEDRMRREGGA